MGIVLTCGADAAVTAHGSLKTTLLSAALQLLS